MPAEIRRHQTNLICSGLAVIAFGVWSIVRAAMTLWLNWAEVVEMAAAIVDVDDVPVSLDFIVVLAYLLVCIPLLLDLGFRLYAGLSAYAEGSGMRKRITYVVLSILYLVIVLGIDAVLFVISAKAEFDLDNVVVLVVELTSCIAFYQIIRSSLAIRRYERGRDANAD